MTVKEATKAMKDLDAMTITWTGMWSIVGRLAYQRLVRLFKKYGAKEGKS